jgi:hypothetical protein
MLISLANLLHHLKQPVRHHSPPFKHASCHIISRHTIGRRGIFIITISIIITVTLNITVFTVFLNSVAIIFASRQSPCIDGHQLVSQYHNHNHKITINHILFETVPYT